MGWIMWSFLALMRIFNLSMEQIYASISMFIAIALISKTVLFLTALYCASCGKAAAAKLDLGGRMADVDDFPGVHRGHPADPWHEHPKRRNRFAVGHHRHLWHFCNIVIVILWSA